MNTYLKTLWMGISTLSVLAVSVNPASADNSLFDTPLEVISNKVYQVKQFAKDTYDHVHTQVGHKVDAIIDDVAQAAGEKAAKKIIQEIFKVRGIHGETASGEHVTIYNDRVQLIHALIEKFTGLNIDNQLALPFPGGKQATQFILGKLEDYFAQRFLHDQAQNAIKNATKNLVHYGLNTLKSQAQAALAERTTEDAFTEEFKRLSSLVEATQWEPSKKSNPVTLDPSAEITARSVVDFYIAKVKLGLDSMIRSTINEQIIWAVNTIESRGVSLGYSAAGTLAAAGATLVINPAFGILVGGGLVVDQQLDLGGKQKFEQLLGAQDYANRTAVSIQKYIAQTDLPLPEALKATPKDIENIERGTQLTSKEIDLQLGTEGENIVSKDWVEIEVVGQNHTLTNYVKQQATKALTAVSKVKTKTVEAATAVKTAAVETVKTVANKTTGAVSKAWGWVKSPFSWATEKAMEVVGDFVDSLE